MKRNPNLNLNSEFRDHDLFEVLDLLREEILKVNDKTDMDHAHIGMIYKKFRDMLEDNK